MRTTIKDIAEKTGFSIATVSMILSGKDRRISEATRQLVLAAAKEMNYRPNQAAVNLKLNRSMTIGLICPDISNDFYAGIAKGLEEACSKRGFSLMLCNTLGSWERELEYIEILESKGIDGVIIFNAPSMPNDRMYEAAEKLSQDNIPVIQTDHFPEHKDFDNCSFVVTDFYKGGALAAEHLLELGHKRAAIITGPRKFNAALLRANGFKDVMAKAGCPVAPENEFEGDYSYGYGLKVAEDIQKTGATAVFCSNDMMALGLIHQLIQNGVKVPEDVSVVGFDGVFAGEISEVALTTVAQPTYEIGLRAGDMICDIAEKKAESGQEVNFEPSIIIRSSTAKAKE